MVKPMRSILDKKFLYVPAGMTDVSRTWRKYGWTPPSERQPENVRQLNAEKGTRTNPVRSTAR